MFAVQRRHPAPDAGCAASSAFGFCISGRQGYRSRQNELAWRIPLGWEEINPPSQLAFQWNYNRSANQFAARGGLIQTWTRLTVKSGRGRAKRPEPTRSARPN